MITISPPTNHVILYLPYFAHHTQLSHTMSSSPHSTSSRTRKYTLDMTVNKASSWRAYYEYDVTAKKDKLSNQIVSVIKCYRDRDQPDQPTLLPTDESSVTPPSRHFGVDDKYKEFFDDSKEVEAVINDDGTIAPLSDAATLQKIVLPAHFKLPLKREKRGVSCVGTFYFDDPSTAQSDSTAAQSESASAETSTAR